MSRDDDATMCGAPCPCCARPCVEPALHIDEDANGRQCRIHHTERVQGVRCGWVTDVEEAGN